MTVGADRGGLLLQQELGLRGGMRVVTAQTAVRGGSVLKLGIVELRRHRLVAAEAELVSCLRQSILVLRRVRVVASGAAALEDRGVDALRVVGNDLAVAAAADPAGLCCQ